MRILKSQFIISIIVALAGLWQVGAANATTTSSCATPDSNTSITTCYYDLTTPGSNTASPTSAVLNGGVFQVPGTNAPVVGTGVLNPFVRIQETANGSTLKSNGVEAGFNTSAAVMNSGINTGTLLDDHDNGGTNWNHAIQLGDLCKVTVNGVDYYQFSLDINEQGNKTNAGLSLDEFKLFYADSGSLSSFTGANDNSGYTDFNISGATLAYNMDNGPGGDASILMDYRNFSGSGKGIDLQALVPVTNFANASANSYIYLYSKFGATGNTCLTNKTTDSSCMTPDGTTGTGTSIGTAKDTKAGSLSMMADAGFEEWSLTCKQPGCDHTVPEPQTMALMGLGVIGMVLTRRRVAA
jgi:hypothetical protein